MTVHPETASPCNCPESDAFSLSAGATITVHPLSITPSSLVLGATITVHPAPVPTLLLSLRLSRSFSKECFPCISKFHCLSNQVGSGLSWHILKLSWCQVCILFWSATRYWSLLMPAEPRKVLHKVVPVSDSAQACMQYFFGTPHLLPQRSEAGLCGHSKPFVIAGLPGGLHAPLRMSTTSFLAAARGTRMATDEGVHHLAIQT